MFDNKYSDPIIYERPTFAFTFGDKNTTVYIFACVNTKIFNYWNTNIFVLIFIENHGTNILVFAFMNTNIPNSVFNILYAIIFLSKLLSMIFAH